MPQAGEGPDDEHIEEIPSRPDPAAAQGDIHIIPEPGAQGHMPAPPELRGAAGEEGIIEVFQQVKAEDPAQADGHIAVAGEIKVNLQGKGHGIHPHKQHRLLAALPIELGQLPQLVGQQDLFAQAQQQPPHAQRGLLQRMLPVLQLPRHIGIAHDGPGDQLGEHGDIGAEIHDGALGGHIAPVHIDGVAEDLEGIKADADGQRYLRHWQGKAQGIEGGGGEAGVFEPPQQAQTDDGRKDQQQALFSGEALHQQTKAPAHQDGQGHQQQIDRLAPAVKHQGEHQQHGVFEPEGHGEIQRQHCRKKIEYKGYTGKQHKQPPEGIVCMGIVCGALPHTLRPGRVGGKDAKRGARAASPPPPYDGQNARIYLVYSLSRAPPASVLKAPTKSAAGMPNSLLIMTNSTRSP